MNYDYSETPLSKSVLAGLATGIIATVLNLIYNFICRGITKLSLSFSVINVSTIIFATVLLCIIAGLVYYFIVLYLKKSIKIYEGLFIVITITAILLGMSYHRSTDLNISRQFEVLYLGMIIITGLFGAYVVPWLARDKNAFFD